MRVIECPKADRYMVGINVDRNGYFRKADAEQAARYAKATAERYARMGYDFGYATPGEVIKGADGIWWVVMP